MLTYKDSAALEALFRKTPRIGDEIRGLVNMGEFPGIDNFYALKNRMERYLDPMGANTISRGGGLSSLANRFPGSGYPEAELEAIVLSVGRPTMLVRNGTYEIPPEAMSEVRKVIQGFRRNRIDQVIAGSARIELVDVPRTPYVGTGWVVEKIEDDRAILVTNRHVVEIFATSDGAGGYRFRTGPNYRDYEAKIDFGEEYQDSNSMEIPVVKVLFISGPRDPDIALIEVKSESLLNTKPIVFSSGSIELDMDIGVVGYPAYDSRNDPDDVARYFGNIFDVKRFSYGEIIGISDHLAEFSHDATTLGGNSGSCIFNLDTGEALGLHFAGDYKVGNYAVPADEILKALQGLNSSVFVPRPGTISIEARGDGRSEIGRFEGRDGYNARFLGRGYTVNLPNVGGWEGDVTEALDADTGNKTRELKYRHFSIIMSQSRRLPLVTGVNIDGSRSKRLGRVDRWYIDERLSPSFQVDNSVYYKNPLDRGHMVRREDPVWGTIEQAKEANIDTFHYTNCAPQHEALNQRDWVALEDYILGSARVYRLRVSVFTGPIFKDNDPLYRDTVRLPRSFWKIAVIVDSNTRKLSATGYILCQGELVKNITEAFVYGDFRTYQVPLSLIEQETRLDLMELIPFDPFQSYRRSEGLEGTVDRLFVPISSSDDIWFE